MSTDHVTFDNPVWGSPDPEPRRWGVRETAVAVGIAAVIAGLGGAAIYAATGESSPAVGPPGQHAFGPGGSALHGQFVVSDDSGGYTTVLTQTGTVTAASPTSVTVRSADGFSQTYLTSASSFAVNDTVMVRAVKKGDTATATEIVDPQTRAALPGGGGPTR